MAEYDTTGKKEESKVFPFSLRFKPTAQVHTLFPKEYQGDVMAFVS